MCWNAKVSLQSFIIGSIAIMAATVYGGLPFPTILFYSSIVFMQLIEYVIWTYGAMIQLISIQA